MPAQPARRRGTAARPPARRPAMRMFPAARAKNQFAEALQAAIADGVVGITRYGKVEAYVISPERYTALTEPEEPELDLLTEYFDEMVASMQTPESRAAVVASFNATPEELGRAAVAAARRRRRAAGD